VSIRPGSLAGEDIRRLHANENAAAIAVIAGEFLFEVIPTDRALAGWRAPLGPDGKPLAASELHTGQAA